jgi:hypothetical protein
VSLSRFRKALESLLLSSARMALIRTAVPFFRVPDSRYFAASIIPTTRWLAVELPV